jgi:hypothetical protein
LAGLGGCKAGLEGMWLSAKTLYLATWEAGSLYTLPLGRHDHMRAESAGEGPMDTTWAGSKGLAFRRC